MGASVIAYWPGLTEEQMESMPGFSNDDRAWGNWMAERDGDESVLDAVKRLKAEALTGAGGRYVVALETARMFENIDGAVMTPEQYIAFVRSAWALIGVSGGGAK